MMMMMMMISSTHEPVYETSAYFTSPTSWTGQTVFIQHNPVRMTKYSHSSGFKSSFAFVWAILGICDIYNQSRCHQSFFKNDYTFITWNYLFVCPWLLNEINKTHYSEKALISEFVFWNATSWRQSEITDILMFCRQTLQRWGLTRSQKDTEPPPERGRSLWVNNRTHFTLN